MTDKKAIIDLRGERRRIMIAMGDALMSAAEVARALHTAKDLAPQLGALKRDGYLVSPARGKFMRSDVKGGAL